MTDLRKILHVYEPGGSLHADHHGKRGITEQDIEEVLTAPAYIEADLESPEKFYATGPTNGRHAYLMVIYRILNDNVMLAITAWPAGTKSKSRRRYMELIQEGRDNLWIPAKPTNAPS